MLELEHEFRVVDVHARLDPDEDGRVERGRDISPDRLEREMHQAGVVRSVVSPGEQPEGEGYLRANNAVARLSVERPFLAFARLNGPRDVTGSVGGRLRNLRSSRREHHTAPDDVEKYAYDDRFHGFVLDPVADGLPNAAVLEVLADVGAPVLVHGSTAFPPSAVEDALLGYQFPVVLTSFGGFPLDRELMHDSLALLDGYDDLYLDTGFVRYRDVLETGLLEHPDRIVFGSGAPEAHPNVGVMEILTLDVPEDAMRKVFSKNPSRVVEGLGPGEG